IEGFSHLRIGGAGSKGKGGGLLIKPGIGKFTNKIDEFREEYIKSSEEASPGYYKVVFQSGIKAEMTVSERVGFHQYTFPENKKNDRYVVVELSHSYVGMLDARLNVKNDREITGMIKSLHNNRGGFHQLYFAIVADTPFESYTSWKGDEVKEREPVREGNNTGVWLNYSENSGTVVRFKVGLSPVSEEQAMVEAKNEIEGWDFEKARDNTASVWKEKLSKIEISGGTEEFKTLFYTHLYHSYLVPNNATSSNGTYRAARLPDSLLFTNKIAPDFVYYSTWSLWDDFRKYSLISLMEPETSKNIARSLVDYYKHRTIKDSSFQASIFGGVKNPRFHEADFYWPTPSIRMEFTSAVIMDAFNKGLVDLDMEWAFKGMKEDYEGYDDQNVSGKLEKAYHAYSAMKMAQALGKDREAEELKKAALAYRDLWCPEQKDNQGNIRGFFTPDGNPVPNVEEFEKYVYEGNLWHYRWFVLHDIEGLAGLRGSKELLSDDLEYFFENDFYMHLNEPDIQVPFMFNFLGKPYLTQKWARTYTTKEVVQLYHNHGFFDEPVVKRIYRTDPKGYIETMDDDAGAMASWFVMSAMGLFPFDPVEPYYLIGSPIFPELTLHLDSGHDFKIIARNVSEENFYIQSAKLNGEEYNKPWIEYQMLMEGGTLEFEMGPEPNINWGSDPKNVPPSMSKSKTKGFYLGIDNSGDKRKPGEFFNAAAIDALGVDFVVYKYRGPTGTIEEEAEKMEKLTRSFEEKNLNVVINVESGNWRLDMFSKDGHNWVRQPDNLHLFKFPPPVIKNLNRSHVVWGMQYDELEHSQITRNLTLTLHHPGVELVSLAEPTGMDFLSADKAV
ncbi:MAG: GH92 family glycosyl hydrolase, partial [Mariniphaga sp.]|nr:GH92 family glycosyl hydrolase [Mariniphaga sp.]